jgi:hypothetical protein
LIISYRHKLPLTLARFRQTRHHSIMRIDDDHKFHGAALNQIAEDPHFTAINVLTAGGTKLRNSFRINDDIGVHLKYANEPRGAAEEYKFTFTAEHLADLRTLGTKVAKAFVALVCVQDRHICCLELKQLQELVRRRRDAMGGAEDQYVVLVTLPKGKNFRVYVSVPGRRGQILGEPILVARNDFPAILFDEPE